MDDLRELFSRATYSQLSPLGQLVNSPANPSELVKGILWLHGNALDFLIKDEPWKHVTYSQVLCRLLGKLGVAYSPKQDCEALEELLVRAVFASVWDRLGHAEKGELTAAIQRSVDDIGKSKEWTQVGGLAGVLAAAKLGGFGTYVLASSAISGVAGAVGLTLPFAVYTGVSSALSVALGPVGIVGVAIYAIHKLGETNFAKLLPIAIYIAALRQELKLRPNIVRSGVVQDREHKTQMGLRLL